MEEKNVKKCHCDVGFENGAILKSIEEESFKLYGNLVKDNYIVIKYEGILCKHLEKSKNSDNIYVDDNINIIYYFNDDLTTLRSMCLTECLHSENKGFCSSFKLDSNNSISFYFTTSSGTIDNNNGNCFRYEIKKDPIKALMEKYCDKPNESLPTIKEEKQNMFAIFFNWFEKIRQAFSN